VRIKLNEGHNLIAVLAVHLLVQTPLCWHGVAARDALLASGIWAANQRELAAALIVPLEVLTGAFMATTPIRALDPEAVQLILDD
jgi:hypothetical protein